MHRPVLTHQEMRDAEAREIARGTAGYTLMQRAGGVVASHLNRKYPEGRIRVLCGPGGNGGDGFVAARALAGMGRGVEVFCSRPISQLGGDAAEAAASWEGPVRPLEGAIGSGHEITLDALFGAGLARPLEGVAARLAGEPGRVVSVDVPSGINGLTGWSDGPAFTAALTVTFQALRPAHLLAHSRAECGELVVEEIGVPITPVCSENVPENWRAQMPWPEADTHKHARGRLVVVTGGMAKTGAGRLAARAGLRVGAGLVTLLCPPSATLVVASHVTAEMVTPVSSPEDLAAEAEEADAVVIGPAAGVSDETRENVFAVLAAPARAVLDADALTVFQEDPGELFDLLRPEDVLTPHPGEFRRLFGDLETRAANRIEAARMAAEMAGCVVLLKGPDTVIASPDGFSAVNVHAAPWLATAGSGDVLAGLIAGLMAQGMDAFDAACAGAWMHGDAGRRFGPGLVATDLPGMVPAILRSLLSASA
ncbi:MAG: NAD(P)H-hydrate dehydratase [Hyphomonadaceae bacterium]|nr:NAD(P)H-hydrate dehydratase [Hyphomonadaceae bacterium]